MALLTVPCFSWASPEDQVGDYVKFRISYFGMNGIQVKKIVKYDAGSDSYLVWGKLSLQGLDPEEGEDWVPSSAIATKAQGQNAVSECLKNSGTIEKFRLGSEAYDVCRRYFYKDTSYQLFGPFPLDGIAGFVSKDDTDVAGELLEFRWGESSRRGESDAPVVY
jgi:hypothetical protein